MWKQAYKYIIVGGGVAGGWAVAGIREHDKNGPILILCREKFLPYDRPPMTKKLWSGKETIPDIFPYDSVFYAENGVDVALGTSVTRVDPADKTVTDHEGHDWQYEKLLLATGGVPRTLDIPGGDLWGICYYRYLEDYVRCRRDASEGRSAVVIGGGFIGSELASSLNQNKINVTMIYPEPYVVSRVFPEYLGKALQSLYQERGVRILSGDVPASIEQSGRKWVTQTRNGERVESDMLIAGLGIVPAVELAQQAGLKMGNGIYVDELCQTSNPDIFAAGDNADFLYLALEQRMRIEHWDNGVTQGTYAGRNMAGANQPYDYMPYFWSDLFEFGYEAVGDLSSKLETFADWEKENDTGVIYYLKDGKVRGVMTCNIYGRQGDARELIGKQVSIQDLRGAIRSEEMVAA
ncbi:MAG TPA: FAD-dependent oxidoreductase [Armatimonadota bacterium]|nr:FAD-dependent oxidoreductase [Armatimonadota bacterium]